MGGGENGGDEKVLLEQEDAGSGVKNIVKDVVVASAGAGVGGALLLAALGCITNRSCSIEVFYTTLIIGASIGSGVALRHSSRLDNSATYEKNAENVKIDAPAETHSSLDGPKKFAALTFGTIAGAVVGSVFFVDFLGERLKNYMLPNRRLIDALCWSGVALGAFAGNKFVYDYMNKKGVKEESSSPSAQNEPFTKFVSGAANAAVGTACIIAGAGAGVAVGYVLGACLATKQFGSGGFQAHSRFWR